MDKYKVGDVVRKGERQNLLVGLLSRATNSVVGYAKPSVASELAHDLGHTVSVVPLDGAGLAQMVEDIDAGGLRYLVVNGVKSGYVDRTITSWFEPEQVTTTPLIEIEVCERLMDAHHEVVADRDGRAVLERRPKYHAQIKGKPGIWAAGTSRDDAIGNLVRCHPQMFNVAVEYLPGKLPR